MLPRNKTPLDKPQARDAALRLLGRREHSARELKAKLRARGLEDAAADEVVENLGEQGWQSDARYAELLLRSRVAHGYGRLRIEAELRLAGIADAAIREALDAAGVDWDELAQRAWSRKFGEPPATAADRQKQYRYLAGRGFESGQIGRLLRNGAED